MNPEIRKAAPEKFQLHVSGLNLLSRCGVAFERRYILGERTPPSASMVVGTAVDRAVRRNLQHKIDAKTLMQLGDVQDTARDALNDEWANGIRLSEDDAEEVGQSKGDAVDAAVDLAGYHHTAAAPMINPTHVARSWTMDVEDLNIQLAGEIDIQEGLAAIRDTKTSGKSPVKNAADISLQLTTYALAVRQMDGEIPKKMALDVVVRTPKRHDLKLVQLETKRNWRDLNHLAERVYRTANLLERGMFTPAPVDAWWCSQKYCGYWDSCKFAARPSSVTVPSGVDDLAVVLQQSLDGLKEKSNG